MEVNDESFQFLKHTSEHYLVSWLSLSADLVVGNVGDPPLMLVLGSSKHDEFDHQNEHNLAHYNSSHPH